MFCWLPDFIIVSVPVGGLNLMVVPTGACCCCCWPNGVAAAPKGVDAAPPNEMEDDPKRPEFVGWLVVVPKRPLDDVTDGVPNAEPAGLNAEPNLKRYRHD